MAAALPIAASGATGAAEAIPSAGRELGEPAAGDARQPLQVAQIEDFPRREIGGQEAGAGTLTELELMWADAAWGYFEDMTAEATGLVPLRTGIAHASVWSVGDQVAALLAARRLELIDAVEFDRRFSAILGFLNSMSLSFGELPNISYSVETGAPLGADFQPGMAGWSAVDAGRLLIWLRIAATEYPFYENYIRNAVSRLDVCNIVDEDGRLLAARPAEGGPVREPEIGRGYDAYAIQGFRAWGLDLSAGDIDLPGYYLDIYGERFQVDETPLRIPPLMTAPPAYLGIEFGFEPLDPDSGDELIDGMRTAEELLETLHAVQEARYRDTGILTARTDYRRATAPFALYDTVIASGYPWSTIDASGAAFPRLSLLSTRAAFAMATLLESDYAETVLQAVTPLYDENGWGEGRYEISGAHERTRTSATNAFILEALAYREAGQLFPPSARPEEFSAPVLGDRGTCRLPLAVNDMAAEDEAVNALPSGAGSSPWQSPRPPLPPKPQDRDPAP